ncbi:JAB domain-containing protein [Sorangium sp. So ce1151]|uniref:JAB domain-containing protein n=1 Tax=Sorangium sp. So ce1151 TaxID=3133332 RepID=UPI003F5ED7A1
MRRSRDVARFFHPTFAPLVHEEVWMAALDAHDRVRGARMVCRGGLLGGSLRAADVLRAAIELGAVAWGPFGWAQRACGGCGRYPGGLARARSCCRRSRSRSCRPPTQCRARSRRVS